LALPFLYLSLGNHRLQDKLVIADSYIFSDLLWIALLITAGKLVAAPAEDLSVEHFVKNLATRSVAWA
jgi:hypothetical protein